MKRCIILVLVVGLLSFGFSFAQDMGMDMDASIDKEMVIKGSIDEISEEGSYITVNGKRILVSADFLDSFYLDEGDGVKITAQKDEKGIKALDWEYIPSEDQDQDYDEMME